MGLNRRNHTKVIAFLIPALALGVQALTNAGADEFDGEFVKEGQTSKPSISPSPSPSPSDSASPMPSALPSPRTLGALQYGMGLGHFSLSPKPGDPSSALLVSPRITYESLQKDAFSWASQAELSFLGGMVIRWKGYWIKPLNELFSENEKGLELGIQSRIFSPSQDVQSHDPLLAPWVRAYWYPNGRNPEVKSFGFRAGFFPLLPVGKISIAGFEWGLEALYLSEITKGDSWIFDYFAEVQGISMKPDETFSHSSFQFEAGIRIRK